ncbi:PLP-dependent aminotransferase family protein [bacterium]|nr:PLP-dependent aminotransferase family protein [bacterium]
MLILKVNKRSEIPLFKQVFERIKELIEQGVLKPGDKLPSSRDMAVHLGVHRSTVYKAYEELWAFGYIDSRPGSYSIVREREELATLEKRAQEGIIPWNEICTPLVDDMLKFIDEATKEKTTSPDTINLAMLDLDPRIFPVDDFRKCLNGVLVDDGARLLTYGDAQGYRPLREAIAKRLQIHSIEVAADEIMITNGAQHGLETILKLLIEPGNKVLIESPTYAIVIPLMQFYRSQLLPIPMREEGLDLAYLRKTLEKEKASFLYTMPNFHNPTGISTNQAHREELLALCEEHKLPIVEDAFEEEMKYFGKVPLPLKSMDKKQIVIYLGTFSKVLFPGIRVGWIAAEKECIKRLVAIRKVSDLSSNMPLQAALAEFCEKGHYELHVKRMHRIFRKRMQTALKAMKDYITVENVSWTEPTGGYLIWLHLKNCPLKEERVHDLLLKNGVLVVPGRFYFPTRPKDPYYRLSIASLDEDEIKTGVQRIAKTMEKIYK